MRAIALLSDFGTQDGFAGEVRATIYRQIPDALCFDLSHGVPRGNIRSAAWMLASAWPHLPTDCIVCAMVDPGIGNSGVLVKLESQGRTLLAPDNGLAHLVQRVYGGDFQVATCQNSVFLGRDVVAPMACLFALGRTVFAFTQAPQPLAPFPAGTQECILHIDHFGNLILNLHHSERSTPYAELVSQWLRDHELGEIPWDTTLAGYGNLQAAQLHVYWGSSGFLEIALLGGSAAFHLGIKGAAHW